jgi:hypothetical protein
LEEARSEAATAQSLLQRGGGAEEQRQEAAKLLATILGAREAWEARQRGLEALNAGGQGLRLLRSKIRTQTLQADTFFSSAAQ